MGSWLSALTTVLPGRPHWLRADLGFSAGSTAWRTTWSLALVAAHQNVHMKNYRSKNSVKKYISRLMNIIQQWMNVLKKTRYRTKSAWMVQLISTYATLLNEWTCSLPVCSNHPWNKPLILQTVLWFSWKTEPKLKLVLIQTAFLSRERTLSLPTALCLHSNQ